MRWAAVVALFTVIFLTASNATAAPTRVLRVTVEKTSFRIELTDRHVLAPEDLPGVILALGDGSGQQRRIRVNAVRRDSLDPAGEVVLYSLSEQNNITGAWNNVCAPDQNGEQLGFPIAGRFTADARHIADPARLLITCTGGAEAKCIRLGYRPWRSGPDGASLEAHYQACVRMIRADYCGDGVSHTRDGTLIGIVDRIGVHADPPSPGMSLEAGWGPEGAVCVRRTRIPELFGMNDLMRACPEHVARHCDQTAPALLFVSSYGE